MGIELSVQFKGMVGLTPLTSYLQICVCLKRCDTANQLLCLVCISYLVCIILLVDTLWQASAALASHICHAQGGMELLTDLQSLWPNSAIKVVAVTADCFEDTWAECLKSGFHGWLAKPLRSEEMRDILAAIFLSTGV